MVFKKRLYTNIVQFLPHPAAVHLGQKFVRQFYPVNAGVWLAAGFPGIYKWKG